MNKTKHYKSFHLLLGILLIISLFSPVLPSSQNAVARAQPVLVQMAASNPDQIVSVIIQKVAGAASGVFFTAHTSVEDVHAAACMVNIKGVVCVMPNRVGWNT